MQGYHRQTKGARATGKKEMDQWDTTARPVDQGIQGIKVLKRDTQVNISKEEDRHRTIVLDMQCRNKLDNKQGHRYRIYSKGWVKMHGEITYIKDSRQEICRQTTGIIVHLSSQRLICQTILSSTRSKGTHFQQRRTNILQVPYNPKLPGIHSYRNSHQLSRFFRSRSSQYRRTKDSAVSTTLQHMHPMERTEIWVTLIK